MARALKPWLLEYSDDLGSAEEGGDVGYTTGDNFVEPFEQALLTLEVGEVSAPVQTEFGVHLIKLTERSESALESFEDSRERLERDLKSDEVDTLFLQRSEELGNLAFESFDLTDPAQLMGLEIQTTNCLAAVAVSVWLLIAMSSTQPLVHRYSWMG